MIEVADAMPRLVHLRPHGAGWVRFLGALEGILLELSELDDGAERPPGRGIRVVRGRK